MRGIDCTPPVSVYFEISRRIFFKPIGQVNLMQVESVNRNIIMRAFGIAVVCVYAFLAGPQPQKRVNSVF